jgi:hypothetical protein
MRPSKRRPKGEQDREALATSERAALALLDRAGGVLDRWPVGRTVGRHWPGIGSWWPPRTSPSSVTANGRRPLHHARWTAAGTGEPGEEAGDRPGRHWRSHGIPEGGDPDAKAEQALAVRRPHGAGHGAVLLRRAEPQRLDVGVASSLPGVHRPLTDPATARLRCPVGAGAVDAGQGPSGNLAGHARWICPRGRQPLRRTQIKLAYEEEDTLV